MKLNELEIKVIKLGINGEGVSFKNKKTVFVPHLLPKEEAIINVREKKR